MTSETTHSLSTDTRPAALVLRRIPRCRRWLSVLRRGLYRTRHRAAGRAPLLLSLGGVWLALLAAALTVQVTWGYFGTVKAYDSLISIGRVRAGVTLRASLTCNAFEPAGPAGLAARAEAAQPRLWVETCVENRGKEATEGLRLNAVLLVYTASGALEEIAHFPANLAEKPELAPGEKHCYSYPLQAAFDPLRVYRTEAHVTVTNYRGVQCAEGETCREGVTAAADFRVPGGGTTPPPTPTLTGTPLPTLTETPGLTATPDPWFTETPWPSPTETETPPPGPTATITDPPPEPTATETLPPGPEPSATPPPTLTPPPAVSPEPTEPPPPTAAPEPTEPPPPTAADPEPAGTSTPLP